MSSKTIERVELGFVEECESPEELTSSNFPSKVGGKPAWLDPICLPSSEQLACKECQKPCVLLLQIYAPHSDKPAIFHRSMFVFLCVNPACFKIGSSQSFRVFRCQLPKDNPYYNKEEVSMDVVNTTSNVGELKDDTTDTHSSKHSLDINHDTEAQLCTATIYPSLCVICGCPAPTKCGQCKSVWYCSQHHQLVHWKNGHKQVCKDIAAGKKDSLESCTGTSKSVLLPEFEIVTETEPNEKEESNKSEEEKMADYLKYVSSESYQSTKLNASLHQLQDTNGLAEKDKMFINFKKRVALEPEQVVRFQPGGEPLLISEFLCPKDIPCCEVCGKKRQFEFQIMPQLLYYLKVDSSSSPDGKTIDWGTLLIYTCSENCNIRTGYQEEFLWKQDLT